jgi:hypothetical protein
MVLRMSVACTAERRSSARVTCSRSSPLQARPQPDVHRWRVLRLQRAHALERPRDRRAPAFEQELAREQRAVELALAERAH